MEFFKVLKDVHDHKSGYTSVTDELVTKAERRGKFPSLSEKCFTKVNVSCRKTHHLFGCRFEDKKED